MIKYSKKDMKFNIHPTLAFWMFLGLISGAYLSYPLFLKLNYGFLDTYINRALTLSVLSLFFMGSVKWVLKILKKSEGTEIDIGEEIGTNILKKFISFNSILFDRISFLTIGFLKDQFSRDTFKILSIVFSLVFLTFGIASQDFCIYIVSLLLCFISSSFIFFGLIYASFNLCYYYYIYIDWEVNDLNSTKLYQWYKETFYKNRSLLDIIYEKIVPLVEKNKFENIVEYLKKNNIPAFLLSLTVMIYSYLFLILFYDRKRGGFDNKRIGSVLDIISIFNPIVILAKLINVRILFFLLLPILLLVILTMEALLFISNIGFISSILLYNILMLVSSIFVVGGFFYIVILNTFMDMFNGDLSIIYNIMVFFSLLIALVFFSIIIYSFYVSLKTTYNPVSTYKWLKYLLRYNMKYRPLYKMFLYTILSFLTVGIIIYTTFPIVKDKTVYILDKIQVVSVSYQKDMENFFGDFEKTIDNISKLNEKVKVKEKIKQELHND